MATRKLVRSPLLVPWVHNHTLWVDLLANSQRKTQSSSSLNQINCRKTWCRKYAAYHVCLKNIYCLTPDSPGRRWVWLSWVFYNGAHSELATANAKMISLTNGFSVIFIVQLFLEMRPTLGFSWVSKRHQCLTKAISKAMSKSKTFLKCSSIVLLVLKAFKENVSHSFSL